ncbi:MAG: hypothetical protein LH609_12575, partial [Rudanella sp.]|nr:hypothetical protein [Rudanella sp.]
MKKFFAIAALMGLLSVATQSYAQLAVDKGDKFLNLGIGLGGYGGIGFGGGIGLGASLEVGVVKNISVGAIAGFRSFGGYGSYYSIGARGSYHFNELLSLSSDKVDLYAGLGLIYSGFTWNESFAGLRGSYGGVGLG